MGLIPAGAGQTGVVAAQGSASGAHPRRCGADGQWISCIVVGKGSSPQVRGRHLRGVTLETHVGLIPAGAGQTGIICSRPTPAEAHPRRCGADPDL